MARQAVALLRSHRNLEAQTTAQVAFRVPFGLRAGFLFWLPMKGAGVGAALDPSIHRAPSPGR